MHQVSRGWRLASRYGDRDPISAGSAGEAVGRGGSMAEVGMSANPIGAHQVDRDMADCGVDRQAVSPGW